MSLARRVYPVLLAVFPPLWIVAQRPAQIPLGDAAEVCLISAVVAAVVMAVAYAALRVRLRPPAAASAAAAGTLVGLGVFYAPRPLAVAGRLAGAHPALALLGVVALGGVAAWAYRVATRVPLRVWLPDVERYLTVFGTVLVLWSAGQLAEHAAVGARAVHHSGLVRELARPVPLRAASAPHAAARTAAGAMRKRDVYVIVLDEYASADVLRELFGFDNTPFEDSLRALGFRVPASVRSNYAVTMLSVPSLLNFAHVRPLADVMDARSQVGTPATYLFEHNRAAAFLKAQGYRYVFFPSAWFGASLTSAEADETFEPYAGFDAARWLYRSQFRMKLASITLLGALAHVLRSPMEVQAEHAARTFAGIAAVPGGARPTFVLAHVLLPHPPWIVDAGCRPLTAREVPSAGWDGSPAGGAMLGAQLRCLNAQVLRTVRALVARSDPQPIIILQGDHGTESLNPDPPEVGLPTRAQTRERFRAFGAYYLPDGGAAAFPDSTSVVNVLRHVFGYYYGAELPPLPDTMYWSYRRPYEFTPLDADFNAAPARAAGKR